MDFGITGIIGRRVLGILEVNGLALEGREYGALRYRELDPDVVVVLYDFHARLDDSSGYSVVS